MQLSIIVPTYNVAPYLANCLDSLLDQDIPGNTYEIIVVNDGSTDESAEIAWGYEKEHSNIHVHSQENQGLSAARNTGIHLARGKYIYFIDSDDYISRNSLGYVLALLTRLKLDVLCLHTRTTDNFDLKEASNREVIDTEEIEVTDGITYVARHNYLNNVWWYVIRREFLLECGFEFPVGRFVEDANFTANLLTSAQRIGQSSLDFYRYLIRQNSIMRRRSKLHNRKMIADYEKNVYDYEPLLDKLRRTSHPNIDACIRRLESRQQAFVFFLIVRCIKYHMSRKELFTILRGFQKIGAYPMDKFIGKDYHKMKFRILRSIMDSKFLLSVSLSLSPIIKTIYPSEK